MARPKKNASATLNSTQGAAAAAKPAQKTAPAEKTVPAASVERTEELYLQTGGGEWNVSDCKERVIAAYAAAGNEASNIRKLTVYLKPEEGKAYYVVNDEATGSIDL